jgi:uncharacterized membrane protein YraQ (UPF0718 family)/regulator of protease activity HflC (stomatin/prohibitin superfamily)
MIVLQLLQSVLSAAWSTFFLAAPYVLFGLLLAALLQILVSQRLLAGWMGGSGLAAAARAALLGIPLPICSCGIVPIAISLRRKGASRPALLSFLITTPESSADAVVLTWGLMGPLMALARLVTALASAITAAVLAIATGPLETAEAGDGGAGDGEQPGSGDSRDHPGIGDPHDDLGAGELRSRLDSGGHHDHGGHPDHGGHADHGAEDDAYVGFRALGASAMAAVRRFFAAPPEPPAAGGPAVPPGAGAARAAVAPAAVGPWPAGPPDAASAASAPAASAASTPAAEGASGPMAEGAPGPAASTASTPAATAGSAPAASATSGPAPEGAPGPAAAAGGATGPLPLARIVRAVGRHAFVELVDDIVFWLVVGVLAAGVIAALVPAHLVAAAGGGGLGSMLLMLVLAIPMYVCASASTPIAAALIAKGVSPGAALVFLLAGPATNTATVTLLARHFGGRFLRIYLGSVLATVVVCGLALDWLVAATGWQITGRLASESEGVPAFFELLCALALLVLIVWRLWAGATRQGLRELADNLRGIRRWLAQTAGMARPGEPFAAAAPGGSAGPAPWRAAAARRLRWGALAAAGLAYALSGLATVPAGSIGYELRCGRLLRQPLPPGLHWLPPPPFARLATWRVQYPRRADVGFRTDLTQLARRQDLLRNADPAQWHSPVAAMNTDSREASYLAGDENLLEMSFTVRYGLSDPYAFLYRLDREHDLVGLCAQAAARELVAAGTLDELLTSRRRELEIQIAGDLQRRLDRLGAGVAVRSVHIVDLHPPQDAVFAFRDVSSAREDRERRIQSALAEGEKEVPRARGNAALGVAEAQAAADAARLVAGGRAEAFTARAAAFGGHRDILRDLLWLETTEKVLPGRRKFVLPKGTAGRRIVLWPDKPPSSPLFPSAEGEP